MKDVETGADDVPSRVVPRSGLSAQLLLSVLVVTMGSFSFGFNISAINAPSVVFLECSSGSDALSCFPVTKSMWGLIVSIFCLGAMVGSLGTGSLANRYGRRACLIAVNVPYVLGALLMALSMQSWMLLLGRFLIGLGVGASCIVVPMFLSEVCTVETRGQITSAHQLMICIGLLVAELLALFLATNTLWRLLFGATAIPALISLLGMLSFVPESPRYLVQQGDAAGAGASLYFFRQAGYAEEELQLMLAESAKQEESEAWGLVKLLKNWALAGRSLSVAVLLHVAQQFSGINVVFYFSSQLFASEGKSSPSVVPALIGLLNLFMTIVSMWLVERAGRRPLAIGSAMAMVLASTAFTTAHLLGWTTPAILAILGYVASFAVGMGPIPWLMMNELFPTQALASAASLAVATNWTCNFMVGASFGWLSALLGNWLFVPYTVCTALFVVYAWVAIPETKGRPIGFL